MSKSDDETLSDAKDICLEWLAHLDKRRARSEELMRLTRELRMHGSAATRSRIAELEASGAQTFNGDKLAEAVRVLLMFAPN